MKKDKKLCPFSGRKCVECALFRGRHYSLCFSKHSQSPKREKNSGKKLEEYNSELWNSL